MDSHIERHPKHPGIPNSLEIDKNWSHEWYVHKEVPYYIKKYKVIIVIVYLLISFK